MNQKVFLSFAHEDEPLARRIVEQLNRAGMDVFYATENLRVGAGLTVIFDELYLRHTFVVLLTPHSKGSVWVAKELGLALSHQASGQPRLLIPIYRDLSEPHHWLADVKAIQWVGDHDERLGEAIRLAMQGDRSQQDGGFGAFIATLVRVPPEAYRILTILRSMAAHSGGDQDNGRNDEDHAFSKTMAALERDARQRAATEILAAMEQAGVAATDCDRVLQAVQQGEPVPAICADHAAEVRRWARRSEPIHLQLTSELFAMSSSATEGLTLSAFIEQTERWFRQDMPDEELRIWRCQQLFEEAHSLGLLTRSREHVGRLDQLNERFNDPSAAWGPMLSIMAPLIAAFEHEQRRLIEGG